jgi:hypothetical protein
MLTQENFAGLVKQHGLEFWGLKGNTQEIAESPEMRALLEKGNFIRIMPYTAKEPANWELRFGLNQALPRRRR